MKSAGASRTVVLVPARSGSKGIPDKNAREFDGKPLLLRTLELALKLDDVDLVLFSSDSDRYLELASSLEGVTLRKRPSSISQDDTPMSAVIRDACSFVQTLDQGEFNQLMLLDVTNPLRTRGQIEAALKRAKELDESFDGVVSTSKPHFNPAWVSVLTDADGAIHRWFSQGAGFTSRQQAPNIFRMNGLYYIWRFGIAANLQDPWLENGKYLGVEESDHQGISIDSLEDFRVAEILFQQRFHEQFGGPAYG